MIKINAKKALVSFKGDKLKDKKNEDVFLGIVIANVLGENKSNPVKSWALGREFATQDVVELLPEDIVFIKKELLDYIRVPGSWLTGLVCGQIVSILDGEEEESLTSKKK